MVIFSNFSRVYYIKKPRYTAAFSYRFPSTLIMSTKASNAIVSDFCSPYLRTFTPFSVHGGGHERGMRSGTLATHQIVGMGEAFEIAGKNLESEQKRIRVLRDKLWNGLQGLEQVFLNGHPEYNVANYLNVSFNFVEGESLMMALKDAAVSSGSACTSATLEPSYVLRALGLSDELAHSSIRFSFGTYTTEEDIDHVLEITKAAVEKLRDLSPLWDMYKEGIDLSTVEWAEH